MEAGKTAIFHKENCSVLARCDVPVPAVSFPSIVFKKEKEESTHESKEPHYITYDIPVTYCTRQGCGVRVKVKFEEKKNSVFKYNVTFDSWQVYGEDILERNFVFLFGKNELRRINNSTGWNVENVVLGASNNMTTSVCVNAQCKLQWKPSVQYVQPFCNK